MVILVHIEEASEKNPTSIPHKNSTLGREDDVVHFTKRTAKTL